MKTPHESKAKSSEPRDLGFGSVAARESRDRFLNRDGSFNVRRKGLRFRTTINLYQSMLRMTWPRFFLVFAGSYFVINVLFGLLFLACGPAALSGADDSGLEDPFLRAFFFSVQTFSTIGYGHVSPHGLPANIVVTLESLTGLIGFTVVTGMLFARIARPTAKIMFSRNAVVAPYRGIQGWEFRIANARTSQLIEMHAKVFLSMFEGEGEKRARQFHQLRLEREQLAFFPLNWTIVHPIDESSPLWGYDTEKLIDSSAEFLVLLTGIDDTFSQTVHARSSYTAEEVVWNAKFSNIYETATLGGPVTVDVSRLDEIESAPGTLLGPARV